MITIIRTMLIGYVRDIHTLFWTIAFPVGMLIGLGLYFNDSAYSNRLVVGVLTTTILFGCAMVTAFNVMAQRNRGIYKLLRVTPFSTASFIIAMTAARLVLSMLVSAFVLAVAWVMFGVTLQVLSVAAITLALTTGSVCFTAIGFLAANLSKDESNVNMISNLLSFPMLFTSEAFYSLAHAPDWVRLLGQALPFHWFVEASAAALTYGHAPERFWISIAVLAGFSLLCLGAAIVTFRWDTERPSRRSRRTFASGA